jgi:hypothetical protein
MRRPRQTLRVEAFTAEAHDVNHGRMMKPEEVAAYSAACSALVAAWQIYQTRSENRSRSTFEHLREIGQLIQAIRHHDPSELRDRVSRAYSGEEAWGQDCHSYLALLDALELVAVARRVGTVDRKLVDEYLQPAVRTELVSLTAISALQNSWNDRTIYSELKELLVVYEARRRDNKPERS